MASQDLSNNNFGILIAYVLPGFTALQGLPFLNDSLKLTEFGKAHDAITMAGFLLSTFQAVAAGMIVSTARWLILDTVHHRTGVKPPAWDFSLLEKNAAGFKYLVEIHYFYYKFHANMLIALIWSYLWFDRSLSLHALGYLLIATLLFLGSRDTLRRYYTRTGQLLSQREAKSPESRLSS